MISDRTILLSESLFLRSSFFRILSELLVFLNQLNELAREGSLELHEFTCARMVEVQTIGVKAETSNRVVAIAILVVAQNRVTDILHMDSNLILASGFQSHFYKGALRSGLEGVVVGDSILAASRVFGR